MDKLRCVFSRRPAVNAETPPAPGPVWRARFFFRADGTVGYRRELCSGCGSCGNACPFGQIYPARPQPGIYRCDGCYERRQRGEEPVCVLACPVNCLRFAARDQREEVCP
ncbi:4Fe-4S dicluster domain-containing protein [Enterocloster lavalensis]|uniref:4Fe-4S dicluster domain-containing protein n=1 Tax=Enterocloster lavalensis TaxID=460384 RepID=UPI000B86CE5C